ncbi:MAG TPA: leucyl aminopeptidase [Dehalococcoidia bacterium]|nr:leucyl aminopeptidase [Dehalococcoidia bacterium]
MQINVESGDITKSTAKAIIVNLFQGVTSPAGATGAIDKALNGGISALIADGEIKGKKREATLVHTLGKLTSSRVIVAGLGKQDSFDINVIRDTVATSLRRARAASASEVATILHGAGIAGLDPEDCAQAIAEGAIMGAYRFKKYKDESGDNAGTDIQTLTILESDASKVDAIKRGVERGQILAQAACHTRDLANEPGNELFPARLAERARDLMQDAGIEVEVFHEGQLKEMGMGALMGVGVGSTQPPRMIVMKYRGDSASDKTLGLLGKGITFDSGGISIKPAAGMESMKGDMSGAAATIATMWAIGKLKPSINVTGIVPTAENMPGGGAQRPGDVVRAMNGKTIEVINTDAEGRLILADAICYARKEKLSPIIDIATLTGAMMIALGPSATGFFATHDDIADAISEAGEKSGELMWRFPLIDDYSEMLKSTIADIKNTGQRGGGAISAAKFLHFFVEDTPWAHIDMAGTDESDKEKGVWVKGMTGIPTRTLINLVLGWANGN